MSCRALACAGLLLLAACHRSETADVPDADADLRMKTAAKTVADLAAADAAARAPLPRTVQPSQPDRTPDRAAAEPAVDLEDGNTSD